MKNDVHQNAVGVNIHIGAGGYCAHGVDADTAIGRLPFIVYGIRIVVRLVCYWIEIAGTVIASRVG